MKVIYSWRQPKLTAPNRKKIKLLIKLAIELAGLNLSADAIISFIFPGPRTMIKINSDFLNHHYLTDVICFNYGSVLDGEIAVEIFISPDIAKIRAREILNTTYANEMVLYIVHGILHAAGELDKTESQQKKMYKKQTDIIKTLAHEFYFSEVFPE